MTDRGTYIKMSDSLPEHRKIVAAGGDAAWLHVCALAYASRNRTDGQIPEGMVSRLSDRKQTGKLAAKLCEVELWHAAGHHCKRCPQPASGHYIVHDYLEHQRSAARIAEVSEQRSRAGRAGGSKPKAKPKQVASGLPASGFAGAEANGQRSFAEGSLREPQTEEPLRGSQSDADVRPSAGAVEPHCVAVDPDVTAQTILGEYIDRCRRRPPEQVIGQLGKLIRQLLANDGFEPDEVRRGMATWKSRNLNPSTLPSVVNEVVNGETGAGSDARHKAEQERLARQLARAQAREAQM